MISHAISKDKQLRGKLLYFKKDHKKFDLYLLDNSRDPPVP